MSFDTVLTHIKTKLSTIEGIKTCKIGIEANISPADYPIVRIVPTGFRNGDSSHYRICDLLVYYGLPLTEGVTSLETIYAQLSQMEEKVIEAIKYGDNYKTVYQKTLVSSSEVEHYKLYASQFEVSFEI